MPRLSSVAPPDPVAAVVVALSVAAMAATPLAPGWLLPVPAATIVVGTAAVDVAPFKGHGHGCSASSTASLCNTPGGELNEIRRI